MSFQCFNCKKTVAGVAVLANLVRGREEKACSMKCVLEMKK